jgi:ubiquinone/menaquinone biosynthesis C-methylase UbiE
MTQEWNKALDLEKELYYPYFKDEREFLKKHIKQGSLIDLGCGNGRIAKELKGIYTHYTGIDIDHSAINDNNKTAAFNQLYWQSDACKVPFDNGKFDTSLCIATYSNFGTKLDQMINETSRILKKNGVFIGSCYHEDALEKRLQLYSTFGDVIKDIDSKGNVYFKEGMETDISCQYTQEDIQTQLNTNGFVLDTIQKSGPFYLFKATKK